LAEESGAGQQESERKAGNTHEGKSSKSVSQIKMAHGIVTTLRCGICDWPRMVLRSGA
jgi:hypothetical protein